MHIVIKKIKNVNYLSKLKILYCFDDCGIDREGIKDLQLIEESYAIYNIKIKNVFNKNFFYTFTYS